MITGIGTARATTLEVLTRIRWQMRGEGQRNYDPVVHEYTSAVETYPNNADIHFALGQIHQQAGSFDQAIDAYQLARRDSSYEVLARVSSAQCLLTQGKLEAAISQLEQALQSARRSPGTSIDPSVWAARPREEGEEHQAPEVEVSMLLAKAYGRAGRQEQMQAILRQVKQTTPYRDEVSSALAEISARQGDISNALQEYFDLVRHYRSKRQADNAISVLNEMLRMAPQDPRAHDELGDIYISRGLLEEGIAELRLLADIHLRNNHLEQAGEAFRRIGNIYAEMGNTEDAFTNLRHAADLTPDDLDLLREVVGYCCQIGRIKEATNYQAVIAQHYYDTHQVKESVAALQQLIALDRNSYEAYDMLGQTYQSVGEYEQASRVYKNLAKVNPDSSIARERLSTLQELRAKSV
jgi:tetratricopeptide (TPR) repeat protein